MSVVKASSVCLSTMTKGASTHKHSEHAVPPPPVWRHPADGRGGAEAAVEAAAEAAAAEAEAEAAKA